MKTFNKGSNSSLDEEIARKNIILSISGIQSMEATIKIKEILNEF